MDAPLYAPPSTTAGRPAAGPPAPAPTPAPAGRPPVAVSGTRAGRDRRAEVYVRLRDLLLTGGLDVRQRLVEVRLAERLAVSRTPVREALVRLVADGLVERRDEGYYPARLSLAELRDLYELRVTVELRGIARALESDLVRHDAALLEPLRDRWRRLRNEPPAPDPGFVAWDEDFHQTLLRASGNPRLTETLESVNVRIRPVRMYDYLTPDRIERTVVEHLAIVEAVLAGQLAQALAALRSHVGESLEVVAERAAHAIAQQALREP
ncbi:GntR family transcriptional regulator [Streptomyces sp. DSM 44915]|uniref:GntR family transcriptional regulator n=1 Tax=Streptomyces chisholmiae TaxID=3075540 RepID=A0ABU2JN50_9ACTN|nr:GntR family transcriptional regulator [Streptomyces sp. DSM 44915]MDT0266425.1 GntR family transcriptional regulator [Streptomyces sp. DSM 44915]